jgi:hypothetical protein
MNKNLLTQITEEHLKILKIKSLSLIQEKDGTCEPRYIVKYYDDTENSFDEKEFENIIVKII